MKHAARTLLSASMLALAGCTVGPDYHLPAAAAINRLAARAPLEAPAKLTVADDLPPRWWHLYDDPALDSLEEQALAGSTDLRIAAANLARAQAMTEVAEGAAEPEIAVDAAAERARRNGNSPPLRRASGSPLQNSIRRSALACRQAQPASSRISGRPRPTAGASDR